MVFIVRFIDGDLIDKRVNSLATYLMDELGDSILVIMQVLIVSAYVETVSHAQWLQALDLRFWETDLTSFFSVAVLRSYCYAFL